jgi:hypothetical protein
MEKAAPLVHEKKKTKRYLCNSVAIMRKVQGFVKGLWWHPLSLQRPPKTKEKLKGLAATACFGYAKKAMLT